MSNIKARKVRVTPQIAKELLATNRENRSLSQDWVDKLARDMRNNEFPNVGETIKLDENGDLIDGQHRLHAVVQSGRAIDFILVEGIKRDDRYKMDKGRKRSASDELHMRHGMPSAPAVIAAMRIVLQWQVEEIKGERYKPTDAEIVEYAVANRELIGEAVRYGMALRTEIGANPSATSALYFLTYQIDAALAIEFWTGVRKGVGLVEGDPELTLRNTIIRLSQVPGGKSVKPSLAMFAHAWNAKREGKKIRRLIPKKLSELTDESFRLV